MRMKHAIGVRLAVFNTRLIRVAYWYERCGCLPPDMRGFTPRREKDELSPEAAARLRRHQKHGCLPTPVDTIAKVKAVYDFEWTRPLPRTGMIDPSWRHNNDPNWDNIVTFYDEDR